MRTGGWKKYKDAVSKTRAHFVIEGCRFPTIAAAMSYATGRGFDGCQAVLVDRLKTKGITLAELVAPVKAGKRAGGRAGAKATNAKRQREKDEMAELMAQIDERRRLLTPTSEGGG
jgi:hypothetical protein